MRLLELTLLILELNAEIDAGQKLSIDEVEDHIETGDILSWVKEKVPGLDLSVLTAPGRTGGQELVEGWQRILGGYRGQERRKWGVQNNGLSLLLAWTNELIQMREFTD